MNEACTISVRPDGREMSCAQGDNLLEVLHREGLSVRSLCGGEGVCHSCIVVVEEGDIQLLEGGRPLAKEQREENLIVACRATVMGDLTISIPASSLLDDSDTEGLISRDDHVLTAEEMERERPLDPLCQSATVSLDEPSLDDNTSDYDRLLSGLMEVTTCEHFTATRRVLGDLPGCLRENGWNVDVCWTDMSSHGEIIRVSSPDNDALYGLAVDIGTTTVMADLVDLSTGQTVARAGRYNRQHRYGEDVIARINHATTKERGIRDLQSAVVSTINDLAKELSEQAGIRRDEILCVVCAGNTTMVHTLYGLDPNNIRRHPYIPTLGTSPALSASELDLDLYGQARVFVLPAVGSFVGGDIVAGVLATGLCEREKLTLFVDVGTNGEIVFGNGDFAVTCSTSAGPAFEGGGISCGTRAVPGAIEGIEVGPGGEFVRCVTIGGRPARGLCGTGLIDTLASLLDAGVINRSGSFATNLSTPRLRESEEGHEFVLVYADEAGVDHDIVIDSTDIKNLMRSKAAVYAGIRMLLANLSMGEEMIEEVLIAGGFGNRVNLEAAIAIGLFPDLPRERFRFVGNTALRGAKLGLMSRGEMKESHELARMMTYLELSAEHQASAFMDEFVAAQFLPHTDLNLFPSVETGSSGGMTV